MISLFQKANQSTEFIQLILEHDIWIQAIFYHISFTQVVRYNEIKIFI